MDLIIPLETRQRHQCFLITYHPVSVGIHCPTNFLYRQLVCKTVSTHRLVKSDSSFASCWFYENLNWLLDFEYYYNYNLFPVPQGVALDSPSDIVTCLVLKWNQWGCSVRWQFPLSPCYWVINFWMSLFSLVRVTLGPLGWDTNKNGKEKTRLNLMTHKGMEHQVE